MICLASFDLMPSMSRCSSALISAVSLVLADTRIALAAIIIAMATVDSIIKALFIAVSLPSIVVSCSCLLTSRAHRPAEIGEVMGSASQALSPVSAEERNLLKQLSEYAAKASMRPDCKAQTLINWLKQTLKPGGTLLPQPGGTNS